MTGQDKYLKREDPLRQVKILIVLYFLNFRSFTRTRWEKKIITSQLSTTIITYPVYNLNNSSKPIIFPVF